MTAPAHTPGPWVQECEDSFDGVPFIPIAPAAGIRAVCEVTSTLNQSTDEFSITEEDRANARLIAAAPAMLAALEPFAKAAETVKARKDFINTNDDSTFVVRIGDLRRARAVIAKATGAAA